MKIVLPWLCAAGLLGVTLFLWASNRKLAEEAVALSEQSAQTQALQEEVEKLKATGSPAQAERIAQLQKDSEDVMKLRNEVRQLRDEKKVLGQQAQTAQAQAQAAQEQVQAAQAQVVSLSTNLQALQLSSQQRTVVVTQQNPVNACINNLRQLDGAKQQWALENRKTERDLPTEADLAPYLKGGIPKCPAGGIYIINAVAAVPTCSIPGHQLRQ